MQLYLLDIAKQKLINNIKYLSMIIQEKFDIDIKNVDILDFKHDKQYENNQNNQQQVSEGQVSQKDSQFQNDADQEAYKSKSCIEKLKYRCIGLKLQLLNYLQFDQVFDNQTDCTNAQEMKKVEKYYQNGIKKRYGQNFSQSYTQRQKNFGYTFDQVLQQRQQQFERKQKTFWSQFKRLICCQGGNQMEDIEDINPHYYKFKGRRKITSNDSSHQIPEIQSQGFIQTKLLQVKQQKTIQQTNKMRKQNQQNVFEKPTFYEMDEQQLQQIQKKKNNIRKGKQEQKVKVELDDPNYAGRRPPSKRARKIVSEDKKGEEDQIFNTGSPDQYNYVSTNKERQTDIGYLKQKGKQSQEMGNSVNNEARMTQSSKTRIVNGPNGQEKRRQFGVTNDQEQINRNQRKNKIIEGQQSLNKNSQQVYNRQKKRDNNRNIYEIQKGDEGLKTSSGNGQQNKMRDDGLIANGSTTTNQVHYNNQQNDVQKRFPNNQVLKYGDPELLVKGQSNIRKPKQKKRRAQTLKTNDNLNVKDINSQQKDSDKLDNMVFDNTSSVVFNQDGLQQQNLQQIEPKKPLQIKRKGRKQRKQDQEIGSREQSELKSIPIDQSDLQDKKYRTVDLNQINNSGRYKNDSLNTMQQPGLYYENQQIGQEQQIESPVKKARKNRKQKSKIKIKTQGSEQEIELQQQSPPKKGQSQSVALKTRKKKNANHLIVNDLEEVQQIQLDQVITFDQSGPKKEANIKYQSGRTMGAENLNFGTNIQRDDEPNFQPYKMKANDFSNGQLRNISGNQDSLTHKNDPHKTGLNYSYVRKTADGEQIVQSKGIILPKDPCDRVQKHKAEKKRRKNKKEKMSQVKGVQQQQQAYDIEQL